MKRFLFSKVDIFFKKKEYYKRKFPFYFYLLHFGKFSHQENDDWNVNVIKLWNIECMVFFLNVVIKKSNDFSQKLSQFSQFYNRLKQNFCVFRSTKR